MYGYIVHSLLYPRLIIEQIHGWDEQLSRRQDADLLLRALILCGAQILPAKRGVAYQRIHEGHIKRTTVGSTLSYQSVYSSLNFANKLELIFKNKNIIYKYKLYLGKLFFSIAGEFYNIKCDDIAKTVLAKAYALGGYQVAGGSRLHKILCATIGLKRKEMLASFLGKYGLANKTRRKNFAKK